MSKILTLAIFLASTPAFCQVDFIDTPTKSSEVEVDSKNGEVGTKFFNIDGGQIFGTAAGTLLGNLGTGFVNNCLFKRSLSKRSPQDESKTDDTGDEVNSRFFNLNCRPDCNTCYCSDRNCRNQCNKCYTQSSGGNGFGNIFNGAGGNYVNCNSCYCSSNSCYSQCNKCQNNAGGFGNNNNGNYVNCNSCYCSSNSCSNLCTKCQNSGFGSVSNSGNYVNCNSCYCSSSSLCYTQCSKCQNNNFGNNNNGFGNNYNGGSGIIAGTGTANCNICNCAYSNCQSQCYKCNNNYDGWRKAPESNSGSSEANNNNAGSSGVIA